MSDETDLLFQELDEMPPTSGVGPIPFNENHQLINGLNYSHEAMVDAIIANPGIHQNALARMFGYSASWISTVIATDSFQSRLAERREQIVDPRIKATLEEQARGLFARSMEVLRDKFNAPSEAIPDNLALRMFDVSAKALGYGARPAPTAQPDDVATSLVRHADNLVNLLRREKARVTIEGEASEKAPDSPTLDGRPSAQTPSQGPPARAQSCEALGAQEVSGTSLPTLR